MQRFGALYEDFQKARLGCEEAALMLGCSVRHFLRLRERYDDGGVERLRDGRIGRVSQRRAPAAPARQRGEADAEVARVTQLYRERYAGFNVRHFHEFAVREHGVMRGYSWTRTVLAQAGLVMPGKRGGAHRLRRPRKPMRGMMLHQDASKHLWFGDDYCDLVVTLDDAASEITSAFFCEEEGIASSMRGLYETIAKHGHISRVLHRSRQPLFLDAGGGRQGVQEPPGAGGPGLAATRHRAYRGLFA